MSEAFEARVEEFRTRFTALKDEIGKIIVGHDEIVQGVLIAMFVGGHCLLEGVPGLGKTLLVRTLSQTMNLDFSRIQFTPDLMPSDIIGTDIIVEDDSGRKHFEFQKGPVFAQILLADEINRATPKTQSAMLEAMQEKKVTVGGESYPLGPPFLVLATQNPLEQEGTYPLPEAQLDRFLLKLNVEYSSRDEMTEIITRTTEGINPKPNKIMDGEEVQKYMDLVREVVVADQVKDFAVRLVLATHPNSDYATDVTNQYVRWGSSPRGAQALIMTAKVRAMLRGRYNVSFADVSSVAPSCLRHRLLLNFEGEAEGVDTDTVLADILEKVGHTAEASA